MRKENDNKFEIRYLNIVEASKIASNIDEIESIRRIRKERGYSKFENLILGTIVGIPSLIIAWVFIEYLLEVIF